MAPHWLWRSVLAWSDAVGADVRLVLATALKLLEAPLTGESEAVLKDAAPLSGPAALGDWLNMVFKGTAVAQGTGSALATSVDPIAENVMTRKPRSRSQRITDARMALGVVEGGVGMAVVTLLALDMFLPGGLIEPVDSLLGSSPYSLELAHSRIHGTGAEATLQLLQRAMEIRICFAGRFLEAVALGRGGPVHRAASGRRTSAFSYSCFRHGTFVGTPVVRVWRWPAGCCGSLKDGNFDDESLQRNERFTASKRIQITHAIALDLYICANV